MAKAPSKKETSEGAAPKAPRMSRKMMLIAGGGAGAVLLLGGGLMMSGVLGGGGHGEEAHEEAPKPATKKTTFLDLPDILVNLAGADQQPAYLRMKIALEVSDQSVADNIQPVMPRVLDAFQTYLRELRATDLDGSAGMYRLKEELRRRVNIAVHPAKVEAVLFKEMLIQ